MHSRRGVRRPPAPPDRGLHSPDPWRDVQGWIGVPLSQEEIWEDTVFLIIKPFGKQCLLCRSSYLRYNCYMKKQRLDLLLVERGLAETRSLAQRLIMAGQVRVDGQVELKSSSNVLPGAQVAVDSGPRFVSRGGEKLESALTAFNVPVNGRVCADAGASTGGFTDALLQHRAAKVYAIDVGHGILDWKIRQDPRVVVMEGTNAR